MYQNALPSRYLILGTQLTFNIGFYAVVPFMAIYMQDSLAFSSATIGLILGARTFSQQGMFLLGGLLATHFGYRKLMLLGCFVRVLGYLGLAGADNLWLMLLSAVLIGVGGAFFSPCLEALTAEVARHEKMLADGTAKSKNNVGIFTYFAIFGECGALIGPVLGGGLIGLGFQWVAIIFASLFAMAGVVLYFTVPIFSEKDQRITTFDALKKVFSDKGFLLFAIAYSSYLFSYNQLYMALPIELSRINAPTITLSLLFVLASLLIILLQKPISRLSHQWLPQKSLMIGFVLMGVAFMSLAVREAYISYDVGVSYSALLPSIFFVILLSVGQMFAMPTAMSVVSNYAVPRLLPMYYGLLATAGGVTVLLGNTLLGILQDLSTGIVYWQAFCWFFASLLPFGSTYLFSFISLSKRKF